MSAKSMIRSKKCPAGKSVRPSDKGVLLLSAMFEDARSSKDPKSKILLCLLAMLQGLAFECLSQDQWILSMYQAKRLVKSYGVTEEEFMLVQQGIFELQQDSRNKNPLVGMF